MSDISGDTIPESLQVTPPARNGPVSGRTHVSVTDT